MSELRNDPSSGDWVIIAPGRAARPAFLEQKKKPRAPVSKATCPFEHPERTGNWPPLAAYPSPERWRVLVIPNKYPVLAHGTACSTPFHHGLYRGRTGMGRHELVVTRDHVKNLADLAPRAAGELFRVFQDRCRAAAKDPCLVYVVPFFNWGPKAGATEGHPHYQVLALPVVPEHSARSLAGAREYWKKHRRCVRCDVIKTERAEGVRVVEENTRAIAIAPYPSKVPFEVRILTKAHFPYFHKTPIGAVNDVAMLLRSVMRRLKKHANDPDLNFFIHEAPIDGKRHEYHHWHVEVLPRLTVPAGFEFSTGVYVNIVDPDAATAILRGKEKARKQYR
jgi:UDPglucose--hexose-1-phosphate uridylyltransferase